MSKLITIFVEDTDQSRQLLSFVVKSGIAHQLVTDKEAVDKLKEATKFEPPIVLCYDTCSYFKKVRLYSGSKILTSSM